MSRGKEKILLVEDVDSLRDVLSAVLENEGFAVDAFASAEEALERFSAQNYSCVLADFKLPGKTGIELLEAVRVQARNVPYIIMTAFGTIEIAVEAMQKGANDFLCKPFEPQSLCQVVRDVIKHRRIIDRSSGLRTRRERNFLSESAHVKKLLDQARKVARVDTSVLILGESGTGKELVARHIHEHSSRSDEPFVAVNCAAMPAELLESEFFGHEAGSFTGATQTRIGVFEYASNGTIFLDEVGDMPPALQVKLLRALQEREIKRVGGNKTIKVNPRIIAATNVDIEDAIASGKMREDFYYRLAVVSFVIPPLRERRQDVELLTRYYIEYFCNAVGRETLKVDAAADEILRSYSWPGNARELENVIERAVILADNSIKPEHLGIVSDNLMKEDGTPAYSLPEVAERAARKAEIDLITRMLQQTMGNKTKAAQLLGVSYKTLLNKVKEYRLDGGGDEQQESPMLTQ